MSAVIEKKKKKVITKENFTSDILIFFGQT